MTQALAQASTIKRIDKSASGTIYGAFCHSDGEPMELRDSQIAWLEAVITVLMDQLHG